MGTNRLVAIILFFALAGSAFGADDPATAKFRALEEAWTTAIQAQDRARLEAYLRPEYTLTVAVVGGLTSIDRVTWLEYAVSTYVIHEFQFNELVVREYGNTAVVSSRYTQKATFDGGDLSAEFFITDVWVKTGEKWQVSARYSSRPGPGRPSPTRDLPSK